jgi:CBS domain-containing protein
MNDDYVIGTKLSEKKHLATKEKGPSATYKSLKEQLQHTQLEDILPERHTLITASGADSVSSVIKKLIDNNILSLPISDPTRKGNYTAFIDMLDVLVQVLEVFEAKYTGITMEAILKADEFTKMPCAQLANKSQRNPWKPIESRSTVWTTLELMCKWKVHRVPILDSAGELETAISQSFLAKYLAQFVDQLPVHTKTVGELKLGYKPEVIAVKATQKVRDAFVLIRDKNVSGLPVLNENDHVIANISGSDLKHLGSEGTFFTKLNSATVEEWLALYDKFPSPVYVTPETTLHQVAHKFAQHKVHRLFVLDAAKKLVGVVSLGDFLDVFLHNLH